MKLFLAASALLTLLGSWLGSLFSIAHFPNDANDTLTRVNHGVLRVGYTQTEPWVRPGPAVPQGIEPELVTGLARHLHARIDWVPGSEEQLFKALKHREIDLLIGGFTEENPWQDEVGLTRPFLEAPLYVGFRPGPPTNETAGSITGRTVAVRKGTDQGYYVRKQDGRPLPTENLPGTQAFAVGYGWQLRQWGLRNTGIKLLTEKHVMAVPAGENAWQMAVETYLEEHKPAQQAE